MVHVAACLLDISQWFVSISELKLTQMADVLFTSGLLMRPENNKAKELEAEAKNCEAKAEAKR